MRMLWVFAFLVTPLSAVTISTAHGDNTRTGWNNQETILTPATVSSGRFAKLGSYTLDGKVYGQPLFIENVAVPGIVRRDLIIAATMHGSVYALDAQNPGSIIWGPVHLVTPRTVYPYSDGTDVYYFQEVGCKATSVVDVPNGWVFSSCMNSDPNTIVSRVDLATGLNRIQQTIAGSVSGTGDPNNVCSQGNAHNTSCSDTVSGGVLSFNPVMQSSNSALALINGVLYVCLGSFVDFTPYHGWVVALNESLVITALWCSTPNGTGGGVWMGASGGPSSDDGIHPYIVTGNGDWNGTTNWGMSVLRMDSSLNILDWFTPTNWAAMNAGDADLGSGAPIQIPSSSRIAVGSKDTRIFNIDRTCMGHLGGSVGGCGGAQIFATDPGGYLPGSQHFGIYNGWYFFDSTYFPTTTGNIYKNTVSGGVFNTTPTVSSATYPFPGGQGSASSNGNANGIIWTMSASANALYTEVQGKLLALNPSDMSPLFTTDSRASDAPGILNKFAPPTVANGKVYVSAGNSIVVYGLVTIPRISGKVMLNGKVGIR